MRRASATSPLITRAALLVLLGLCMSACGYRLAGTAELPPQMQSIYLLTSNFSAAQERELRRSLTAAGATLVEQADAGSVRLAVSMNALPDRQLVSSASSGATVNRISRSLDFNVKSAAGELLAAAQTLRQQKDIALDDDNLLASNRERENIVLELEQSLFQQLVRQLTRI
jgi:LPS-assembly lipoprotein